MQIMSLVWTWGHAESEGGETHERIIKHLNVCA